MAQIVTKPEAFEDVARGTMQRVQSALAKVVDEIPGIRLDADTSLADLGRHLEIDKKLAWKIGRVVLASDAFEAAQNLPGAPGLDIFLDAAARGGASSGTCGAARSAFKEYRSLVQVHAGDKASFESMLSRYAEGSTSRAEIDQRRAAFRANSHLFGVTARVQLRTEMVNTAKDPDYMDVACVRGFIDLSRTRAGVEWPIGRVVYRNDNNIANSDLHNRELIDPSGQADFDETGVPLFRRFCSQGLPKLSSVQNEDGSPETILASGAGVGRTEAVTCLTAEVSRRFSPRWHRPGNTYIGMALRCYTPCEVLVCDRYVHRETFDGRIDHTTLAVSELYRNATGIDGIDRRFLPCSERMIYMGRGSDATNPPLVPRYREMVDMVFDRTNWNPADFDLYRLVIEYPVIPACVMVRHPLHPKPKA